MKNTNVMLTAFAVFTSFLMLITACVARPVQEKTSINAIEYTQQKLINSLESFNLKLSRDYQTNMLLDSIARDRAVSQIVYNMQSAKTHEELLSDFECLVNVLDENAEFTELGRIIQAGYSAESQVISQEIETAFTTSGTSICNGEFIDWILSLITGIINIIIGVFNVIKAIINLIQSIISFLRNLFGGPN